MRTELDAKSLQVGAYSRGIEVFFSSLSSSPLAVELCSIVQQRGGRERFAVEKFMNKMASTQPMQTLWKKSI